jgi:hypothetical protein
MGSAHFTPFNFRINYININTSSSLIIPKWSEKYLQIVSGFATHRKKEKKKKEKRKRAMPLPATAGQPESTQRPKPFTIKSVISIHSKPSSLARRCPFLLPKAPHFLSSLCSRCSKSQRNGLQALAAMPCS